MYGTCYENLKKLLSFLFDLFQRSEEQRKRLWLSLKSLRNVFVPQFSLRYMPLLLENFSCWLKKIIVVSFFLFLLKLILLNLYLPGRYSSNIRQSALNWCVFLSPFLSCIMSGCKFPFCTKWSIFWKWQWSTVKAINLSLIMLFNRSWNNY